MKRLNMLLNRLTAIRSFDELQIMQAAGYVPTIFPRSARHGQLIKLLREHGIQVWTGV